MGKVVTIKRGLWENLYLPEIIRGLGITLKHFFVNVIHRKETVTIKYPEEERERPERFRGVHRLMKREDGSVRCTAESSDAVSPFCLTFVYLVDHL